MRRISTLLAAMLSVAALPAAAQAAVIPSVSGDTLTDQRRPRHRRQGRATNQLIGFTSS